MNTILRNLGRPLSFISWCALAAVACSDPPFRPAERDGSGGAASAGDSGAGGGQVGTGGDVAGGGGGRQTETGGQGATDDAGSGHTEAGADAGANDGGEGGPDGATPGECVHDADCAAVENPDANHCMVTCALIGGRRSCEVRGKDADGDGHRDAACRSGDGRDCDDTNPAIYSEATEECDGLDNDCDGQTDAQDGLPLGGEVQVVHELSGTASLGIAASSKGVAILGLVRRSARLAMSRTAELMFVDPAGATTRRTLTGEFADEPTIGYSSGWFYVHDQNGDAPRFQNFDWGATKVEMVNTVVGYHGRAVYPFESEYPFAVYVSPSPDVTFLAYWTSSLASGYSVTPILSVAAPAEIHRPAVADGGYAWVESDQATSGDHKLAVKFRSRDPGPTKTLQIVEVVADATTFYSALRFETLRPQLVRIGSEHLVGWMNDAGLEFARVRQDGEIVCRSKAVPGASWAWMNSLTNRGPVGYASLVTGSREPALIGIDEKCKLSEPIPLSPGGKKVALGASLKDGPTGKPFLEVGHPVITNLTVNGSRRSGVAWVEEPGSNGLHPVMFRYLTDKLCD